jgi:hypothetical protein
LELYSKFWLTACQHKEKRIALLYLNNAKSVYDQWGAIAKVVEVQERIARLSGDVPVACSTVEVMRGERGERREERRKITTLRLKT